MKCASSCYSWLGGRDCRTVLAKETLPCERKTHRDSQFLYIIQGVSKKVFFLFMKSYFSFFYVCFRIRILSLFHSATQTMAILNLNGQAKLIFALLVFNQSQYSGLNNLQSQTDRHFPFKEINFLCMQSTQDKYFVYKYFVYSYFVYRYFVHRYFVYSIHASRLSMQGCVAVA